MYININNCNKTFNKNDHSSLCYDLIITHHKLKEIVIFRVISIITVRQTCLEMLSTSLLINVSLGSHNVRQPRAAQASEARLYIYNLYLCNELIEKIAMHRK